MLVVLLFQGRAWAQVNSWTNPASAPWEAMYWSLGVLPDSAQSIMITNAGYKAVGISSSTVINHPASMTVSNLTISAPANAFNTLLLNYSGTATPLTILGGCAIGTSGVIENLYSAFEVQSGLFIEGGEYIERGGLTIATNGGVFVYGGGLSLTNAIFQGSILLDGTLTQAGGETSGAMTIESGIYNLFSGSVTGGCLIEDQGMFNQYAGTNTGDIMFGNGLSDASGQYTIFDGLIVASDINVGNGEYGYGTFYQYGGTVITTTLDLGGYGDGAYNPSGTYFLTNGTLQAGQMNFASGGFRQSGGQLFTTNEISLEGVPAFDYGPALYVSYDLSGGEISCPGIFVSLNGSFSQSGGTNDVSGDLSLGGGAYALSGGLLFASNVDLYTIEVTPPGSQTSYYSGVLDQTGGQLYVENTFGGSGFYFISGGSLYASNIIYEGILSLSSHVTILNPGMFQFAGTLQLSNGVIENLGRMVLSNHIVIEFMAGAEKISFLNSAGMNWDPMGSLVVSNWNGSTGGGGADQLIFGNNSSGLTPAQVRQIVFVNPAGFPAGNYAASILSSGEVVPLPNPILSWQIVQGQLVVSWAGQATLQSSTNVLGPYMDVTNAMSPYTNDSSLGPYRFFRLKRQ